MQILLQLRSKVPIYEQIVTQVKQQVITGALKDGDPIPSMRALAKTLQVSVITVQKAYEELQRQDLIESLAGRGTFIKSPDKKEIQQEYRAAIAELVAKIVALARDSDIPMQDVIQMFKEL